MDNFEAGEVTYGTFESCILVAADDKRVNLVGHHGPANVRVAAVDLLLRGHSQPLRSFSNRALRKFQQRLRHKSWWCSGASQWLLFRLQRRADHWTGHS